MANRGTTTQRGYGTAWQATSEAARAKHVAAYGWYCPGDSDYDHPLHPSRDLVVDHVRPGDTSDLRVVCRSLNTRYRNGA